MKNHPLFLRFIPLLALAFWGFPLSLGAQTSDPGSSAAFPFLSIGLGARAVGMGESFTAVADDFSAIHYNPAGLARIHDPELVLMHNSYLAGGFYDTLGCVYPFGTPGTLALGVHYLNYGSIEKRDLQGNLQGTFTPFDVSVVGAFGFPLGKGILLGLGSQWMRQDINGSAHTGLLWNAAFLAEPFDRFSVGLNFRNLGVETGGYGLPAEMAAGASYRLALDPREVHGLLVAADGDVGFQGADRLSAGLEYGFRKRYFLRVGYSRGFPDGQLGGDDGLDWGAGLRVDDLELDYSFSFVGDLGNIQRFTLAFFLPSGEKSDVPSAVSETPPPPPSVGNLPAASPPGKWEKPVLLKFQVSSPGNESPQELYERAGEKLKLGLKEGALDLYLQAVEKDPDFEAAWIQLGKLYFDKSMESYRKALEMDPKNSILRQWLNHFKR